MEIEGKTGFYKSRSDKTLVILIKTGDHAAYTEIYKRYSNELQDHAFKKLGDFDETKDILQDVFTNLWLKRGQLDENVFLKGYLHIAVRNRILNLMAHGQVKLKHQESLQNFLDQDTQTTDSNTLVKELNSIIKSEVNALPPKMKEVFTLSRELQLSHFEIAKKLNISKETVSKQVTNALKILRIKLERHILFLFLF